jgi:hypothetical protein
MLIGRTFWTFGGRIFRDVKAISVLSSLAHGIPISGLSPRIMTEFGMLRYPFTHDSRFANAHRAIVVRYFEVKERDLSNHVEAADWYFLHPLDVGYATLPKQPTTQKEPQQKSRLRDRPLSIHPV